MNVLSLVRNRLRDTEKLLKIRKFFQQNTEILFQRLAALCKCQCTFSDSGLVVPCENIDLGHIESFHGLLPDNTKILPEPLLTYHQKYLTHCGLVTPYGNKDLGQHWLR